MASTKRKYAPRKRGQPTLYRPEYPNIVKGLELRGYTNIEVAEVIGVEVHTLRNWAAAHPDFFTAMQRSRKQADALVEAALFKKATGYSQPAVKIVVQDGKTYKIPYVEHIPPSDASIKFWLSNRRPDDWKDKRTLAGDVDNPILVEADIRSETLEFILKQLDRKAAIDITPAKPADQIAAPVAPTKKTNGHG